MHDKNTTSGVCVAL